MLLFTSCRSVTIDYNYLKLNKIEFLNDMTIDDVIDHSENTLNLLVPEKLKQYKNKIIKNYTDYANFQKVEVYNIYANALGTKIKQIDDVNTKSTSFILRIIKITSHIIKIQATQRMKSMILLPFYIKVIFIIPTWLQ